MFSGPSTPLLSRPPQRTYGRRGANGKRQAPRQVVIDSDSDTETEEADGAGSKASSKASTPAPSERAPKRARTSLTPGTNTPPTDGKTGNAPRSPSPRQGSAELDLVVQPPSSSVSSRPPLNGTPTRTITPTPTDMRLSAASAVASRESTPQKESQGSTASFVSAGGARRPPRPRRMLSKAQSMAAPIQTKEDTPPSTPRKLQASQSMPLTPGSATSNRTVNSLPGSPVGSLMVPVVGPGSPTAGRAKRIYGRNRTFLETEMSVDTAARESYAELRKRYEVDNDVGGMGGSGNLLAELQLARAPEPISDMRSKGESKRFADEISYLLGGITDASSMALKRNSSIDVLSNMQEDGWVAKLDIHGETERIFEALCAAKGTDDIMDSVVLLFLAILAAGNSITSLLQGDPDTVTTTVAPNLAMRNGPLDAGYKGKVTNAVQKLRRVATKLAKTTDMEDGGGGASLVTTRGAASLILSHMCRDQVWSFVEYPIITRNVARDALNSLATEIRPLSNRLELYAKGLDIMPKEGGVNVSHVQHCLLALSSIVRLSADERARLADNEGPNLKAVMAGMVVMSLMAMDSDLGTDVRQQAARCTVLALEFITPMVAFPSLRNVLAVAHEQAGFLTALSRILSKRQEFATLAKPSTDDTESQAALGHLVNADDIPYYVLAILGSMIEASAGAASKIATTGVASCGKRACALACQCGGDKLATMLTTMYAWYTDRTRKQADEAFTAYLSGYLAWVITKLLDLYPSSRPSIEPHLPNDTWKAKLAGLLAEVKELTSFRATAHGKLRDIVETSTAADGDRSGRIRANTPGAEDNEKLHEAIAFLEQAVRDQ